jgi:hypothetical protein
MHTTTSCLGYYYYYVHGIALIINIIKHDTYTPSPAARLADAANAGVVVIWPPRKTMRSLYIILSNC